MRNNSILMILLITMCFILLSACNNGQDMSSDIKTSAVSTTKEYYENTTALSEKSVNDTDCYKVVGDTLSELCKNEKYINSDDEGKVKLAMSTLDGLESEGYIIKGSVSFNESSHNNITFKYANGVQGAFLLKEFGSEIN